MNARIGRGFGLGPVFVYDWITSTRRWHGYALRSLFVLSLLAALLVIGIKRGSVTIVGGRAGLRELAQLAEGLFVAMIGTQLTLVLMAAPAATAGAIAIDRSRGTLTHLLVTDLTDSEIVLGKLAARLVPVLGLVAAAFPVMGLLTLLGGVDPDVLFGAFLITLGVAVLGCCLALVFSIRVHRTHEALLATYAVWGLWLLATPMLDQVNRVSGWSLNVPLRTADPYLLAFAPYWRPGSVTWQDYVTFLAATWGISALLALFAVRTMRRVCTRDVERKTARRRRCWLGRFEPLTRLAPRMVDWAGPSLDFNPVFWREWHRNRPPGWARLVAVAFFVVAVTFSVMAIASTSARSMPAWVNALQVSVSLLFLSVIAATSLAEERVRGSLDVLMTTPLESWQIVIGKWLGTVRLVPPLAILPVIVVVGTASSQRKWLTAVMMVAFVLCSGAAVTSLGLAMATWCQRLGRAVGLTVSLYVLVTVGWLFLMEGIGGGPRDDAYMMASPFFWPGAVTDGAIHSRGDPFRSAAVSWIVAYALAALGLLALTLVRFDHCLGRVGSRSVPRIPPRPAVRR